MCRTLVQLLQRLPAPCLLSAVSFDDCFVNWSVLHPKSESFFFFFFLNSTGNMEILHVLSQVIIKVAMLTP